MHEKGTGIKLITSFFLQHGAYRVQKRARQTDRQKAGHNEQSAGVPSRRQKQTDAPRTTAAGRTVQRTEAVHFD